MTTRTSLTMIVKNESATLDQCLASVRDLVDEIIVVDTGSSDATKEIASQHGTRIFDSFWPDGFAADTAYVLRQRSAAPNGAGFGGRISPYAGNALSLLKKNT